MQNEIMESASIVTRTIEQITADIRVHAQYAAMSIYAIGQDLIDAKGQLQHGQWLPWLREVGISPKTAENYMRITREVTPNSMLASMPYSKALALLDVPAEQRETFVQENNVSERSAAAIKKLIKEKQAAEERASNAEEDAAAAQKELKAIESTLSGANTSNYHLRKQVEQLQTQLSEERSKPRETVTVEVEKEVTPAGYDQMRREFDALRRRCEEAEDAAAEAEERAAAAVANAQRAQMAQLDEDDDEGPDGRPSLIDFISICNEFQSKVWAVPFMGDVFRALHAADMKSYRLIVGGVKSWAERALAAMDEATAPLTAEGVIVIDADE